MRVFLWLIGDGGGDPVDGEGGQKRTHKKKKKEEEVFFISVDRRRSRLIGEVRYHRFKIHQMRKEM